MVFFLCCDDVSWWGGVGALRWAANTLRQGTIAKCIYRGLCTVIDTANSIVYVLVWGGASLGETYSQTASSCAIREGLLV